MLSDWISHICRHTQTAPYTLKIQGSGGGGQVGETDGGAVSRNLLMEVIIDKIAKGCFLLG